LRTYTKFNDKELSFVQTYLGLDSSRPLLYNRFHDRRGYKCHHLCAHQRINPLNYLYKKLNIITVKTYLLLLN